MKIHTLPQSEVWKIAAGEVVERPASVVKELTENALDADASTITIAIDGAGKELIRVIDNGCGMCVEDLRACVLPHATSKLHTIDDLWKVSSFGFRGEALASIVAVSRLSIASREADAAHGVQIDFESGREVNEQKVVREVGTELVVRDLFFNTPARRKFLKQDETEWNQLLRVVHALAFAHRTVSFKLIKDGVVVANMPAVAQLKERACQVWDYHVANDLLELRGSDRGIVIEGLVSSPRMVRYGRHGIFIFVNGRNVQNTPFVRSVTKAFGNALPAGKYPFAVLFITVDPTNVDINVHPRKEEVRLTHCGVVERLIEQTVAQILVPALPVMAPIGVLQSRELPISSLGAESQIAAHFSSVVTNDHQRASFPIDGFQSLPSLQLPRVTVDTPQHSPQVIPRLPRQIFNMYILLEQEDSVLLVDQHAAHERILYERMKNKFEQRDGVRLLFPELVELDGERLARILSVKDELERQGFVIDKFGAAQIVIHSAPPGLQGGDLRELILSTAELLVEYETFATDEFRKALSEHMHSHLACKLAIKAGDILSVEQMQRLLSDLAHTENGFKCIHGRPTTYELNKKQIDTWFGRK